jgi:hypothetical protein
VAWCGWATFVARLHLNLLTVVLVTLSKSATAQIVRQAQIKHQFKSHIMALMRAAIKAGENLWLSLEETKASAAGIFPPQHWRMPTNR